MIQHFGLEDVVLVGLGAGGLVAQGLAVKRLDLVRGLVFSNTALRMGVTEIWERQVPSVRKGGIEAIVEPTLEQAFGRRWREAKEMPVARAVLERTDPEGWMGVASAVAGSDFYQTTATLRLRRWSSRGRRMV